MSETISNYLFYEIAALLVLAAAGGLVGVMLRQPLIVSFIAVGIIAGPVGARTSRSPTQHIDLLAELGIAVLLFLVGLKLDLKLVRTLGVVALDHRPGAGRLHHRLRLADRPGARAWTSVTALYVAVALTFSSTIIIVKLLSDKREIDSLHGRIALGFLIVQDLVVVLAMIVLSALGVGAASGGGLWRGRSRARPTAG
ncbi:MAG: cation:proton antiporter [Xanthomonadales bacterium]|nr:cation:proton antiporter [Xanthomonadales bacterium]